MIAMTTSNSISVNAERLARLEDEKRYTMSIFKLRQLLLAFTPQSPADDLFTLERVSSLCVIPDNRIMEGTRYTLIIKALTTDVYAYLAGSGVKGANAILGLTQALTKECLLSGGVRYEGLMNDAKDSPIVQQHGKSGQAVYGIGVTYLF